MVSLFLSMFTVLLFLLGAFCAALVNEFANDSDSKSKVFALIFSVCFFMVAVAVVVQVTLINASCACGACP